MPQEQSAFPAPEDPHSAVVYFSPEEGSDKPEFLFFEEKSLESQGWRQRASLKGRQFWERTKIRFEQLSGDVFAGDHFVRRVRRFKRITVFLNKPIDPQLVRERLHHILRDRSYHHLRWLIVDLILLPFSILIAPLPGPNVLGYYLLFRVVSHYRSYRAASRAVLDQIEVQVSNRAEEVNSLLRTSKDIRTALQELRRKYGLRALQEHRFIPQMTVLKEAWGHLRRTLKHADEEQDLNGK